jgi:hypothetical protein
MLRTVPYHSLIAFYFNLFTEFRVVLFAINARFIIPKFTIAYQKETCDFDNQFDQEFIFLKIENLTSHAILHQWDSKLWYDESCINCEQDSPEFRKEIRIESGKTMEGNCSEHNALRIFSRFTENLENMPGVDKITTLIKHKFKNINITNE